MNWYSVGQRRQRLGRVAVGASLLMAFGCRSAADGGKGSAPAPSEKLPTAVATTKNEPAPLDRIDEGNFQLSWRLESVGGIGQPSLGELVLVAKPPFKPNLEYPHKLKLEATDIVLVKPELTKADMQVSTERVLAPVRFEVTGPNPTLQGTLAFSVCTAEACLIERKDIRLSVRSANVAGNAGESRPAVGAEPTVGATLETK